MVPREESSIECDRVPPTEGVWSRQGMWGAGELLLHFRAHEAPRPGEGQPGEHQREPLPPGGQAQTPQRPPSVWSLRGGGGASYSRSLASSTEWGPGAPSWPTCPRVLIGSCHGEQSLQSRGRTQHSARSRASISGSLLDHTLLAAADSGGSSCPNSHARSGAGLRKASQGC